MATSALEAARGGGDQLLVQFLQFPGSALAVRHIFDRRFANERMPAGLRFEPRVQDDVDRGAIGPVERDFKSADLAVGFEHRPELLPLRRGEDVPVRHVNPVEVVFRAQTQNRQEVRVGQPDLAGPGGFDDPDRHVRDQLAVAFFALPEVLGGLQVLEHFRLQIAGPIVHPLFQFLQQVFVLILAQTDLPRFRGAKQTRPR